MPYIDQDKRLKFNENLLKIVKLVDDEEKFNFFLRDIVNAWGAHYIDQRIKTKRDENPYQFPDQRSLKAIEDKFVRSCQKSDISNLVTLVAEKFDENCMSGSGELNYCICVVYWALLGDYHPSANYGKRAYLNAIIETQLNERNNGNNDDLFYLLRGVLDHIKHETYRLKTVPYEDEKIFHNGQVWYKNKISH